MHSCFLTHASSRRLPSARAFVRLERKSMGGGWASRTLFLARSADEHALMIPSQSHCTIADEWRAAARDVGFLGSRGECP